MCGFANNYNPSLNEPTQNNLCNRIFTDTPATNELLETQFAYSEHLYITLPKSHPLASRTEGVHFKDIDGQSFLVSNNLGIWDNIVNKNLPKSKFFPQSLDNLYEIVNSSTIPSFSTNITLPLKNELDRISLLILDEDAKVDFYFVFFKKDKQKLKSLTQYISKSF